MLFLLYHNNRTFFSGKLSILSVVNKKARQQACLCNCINVILFYKLTDKLKFIEIHTTLVFSVTTALSLLRTFVDFVLKTKICNTCFAFHFVAAVKF